MNNLEILKDKTEKFLEELNIKFTILSDVQEDEELSYLLPIKLNGLKKVGTIPILLVISTDKNTISIGCSNIYNLKSDDTLLSTLVAINKANMRIASGNLYLDSKRQSITYYQRVKLNNLYEDLSYDVIMDCINSISTAIIVVYDEIVGIHSGKQKE